MPSNYQTKWIPKGEPLPLIGIQCPLCQKGYLQAGKWGGVLCYECKTVWKESKFEPKKGTKQTPLREQDQGELILGKIEKINENIQSIKETLQRMRDFFINQ